VQLAFSPDETVLCVTDAGRRSQADFPRLRSYKVEGHPIGEASLFDDPPCCDPELPQTGFALTSTATSRRRWAAMSSAPPEIHLRGALDACPRKWSSAADRVVVVRRKHIVQEKTIATHAIMIRDAREASH
jgi:hypothetical protein